MKKLAFLFLLFSYATISYSQFGRTESPYNFVMSEPINSEVLTFSDSCVNFDFSIEFKYVAFTVQNKTSKPIKIDWQNASLIINGEAKHTFHEGVKYINRNEIQPTTTIPPKAKINDLLMPTENVSFSSGSYSNKWKEFPMFPAVGKSKIEQMKGLELGVYIPIIIDEKTHDYSFLFVITGFKQVDNSNKEKPNRADELYK